MARKSFISKINAGFFFLLACLVTLFSCDKYNGIDDQTGRSTTSYDAGFNEESKLTPDDYQGTGTLHIDLEKHYGTTSEGTRDGNAVATCRASVETDPVETAHKEKKTFTIGEITPTPQNGNTVYTCPITVTGNGQENMIHCRIVVEPTMVWDKSYDIKVTKIAIDEANVKMAETTKKQGESGRQTVSVPVVFSLAAVGTEVARTCDVTQTVTWEQFQKESTPVIDHEEFDHTDWKLNPDFSIDYMVVLKQVWTEGHEDTFVEYPYASSCVWNVIYHEDLTVTSWAYGLKNIEGLSVGTPYEVEAKSEFFKEKRREDLYAATHSNGQDKDIKCVYSCDHPEVTFTKGDLTHTFNFISPSFTENGDDLLDGTSTKSGYDLRIFRNSVTGKYGNQTTSIQEKVLEERANLYKQAKAVSDVEFSGMKKTYGLWTITYDVDCIDVYNDGTKSEKYHLTTSRPWSLTYAGPWSISTENEVKEVIDAIKLSKIGSKTEDQNISNGKWSCTTTSYDVVNYTTVDAKNQKNAWTASVPTHMILTLHGKTCDFGEDTPAGVAKNDKIELTSSTATSEVYTFSEDLNFTVGDYTTTSQATGTVTKAVEVTVKSWSWENAWQRVEGNLTKAHVEKVYVMTDGSKKTVSRDFTFTRNAQVFTYWETTEANNSETTGAAQFSILSTESKQEGDWKFNLVKTELSFGVTCANSNQKDGWSILEANNLSVEIEGDIYTFDEMSYSASANASQAKTAESDNQTEYTHTNAPTYNFGGYSMNLSAASGKIFVNKTVIPEHHDGFFPKEYGKIEGVNKVACRNPHNQKDWGVGVSVKFTNGSVCGFISRDGIIEWGSFEAGSTVWDGASPDGNGNVMNCTAKDASTAMKWRRGDSTINMMSYSDGTLMGFNDGHNTVSTSKFPETVTQQAGGKYQDVSFAGVRDASGRTSWDSSF